MALFTDGVNNRQNGCVIHSVCYSHRYCFALASKNNGLKKVTCQQTFKYEAKEFQQLLTLLMYPRLAINILDSQNIRKAWRHVTSTGTYQHNSSTKRNGRRHWKYSRHSPLEVQLRRRMAAARARTSPRFRLHNTIHCAVTKSNQPWSVICCRIYYRPQQ